MKSSRPPRILVLYKTSAYAYYFNSARRSSSGPIPAQNRERFKRTHIQHYKTLVHVEKFISDLGLRYTRSRRGRKLDFSQFDLVITVGGDGTFLEAARNCTKQIILGVNSDPQWSVGRFCAANEKTFPDVFETVLNKKSPIRRINRLKFKIKGQAVSENVLNDVLICHSNPAAMSRYLLQVNGKKEEQRSSGVWIAPAAGSTGAIHSAGGRILSFFSEQWQYVARELYGRDRQKYSLKGRMLSSEQKLSVTSLMNHGVAYIDGSHMKYSLRFGDVVLLSKSNQPLKVVMP